MKKVVMIVRNYASRNRKWSARMSKALSQIRSISIAVPEAAQVIIAPFFGAQISSWRFLEPSLKSVIHQQRWTNPTLVNCLRACHSNSSGDFRHFLGSRITFYLFFLKFSIPGCSEKKKTEHLLFKNWRQSIFETTVTRF